VAAATGRKGNVPFELAKALAPDLEEHRFVDETANAMRRGRFLLLIAGDGIREDVGAIAELINRNAALGFSFGLVEVALYGLEDASLVVQPRGCRANSDHRAHGGAHPGWLGRNDRH
jgi:hypothetical protein